MAGPLAEAVAEKGFFDRASLYESSPYNQLTVLYKKLCIDRELLVSLGEDKLDNNNAKQRLELEYNAHSFAMPSEGVSIIELVDVIRKSVQNVILGRANDQDKNIVKKFARAQKEMYMSPIEQVVSKFFGRLGEAISH